MNNDDNFWLNLAAIHYINSEREKKYPKKNLTMKQLGIRVLIFIIADIAFIMLCNYLLAR